MTKPGFQPPYEAIRQSITGSATKESAADLVIVDDMFPHQSSGFRLAEYRRYLEHFSNSILYSTGDSFPLIGDKRKLEEVIQEFESINPHLSKRVARHTTNLSVKAKGLYFVFLSNYEAFSQTIRSLNTPFMFTLYPGGGFRLYEKSSNALLRKCLADPLFRKAIVTQPITREYLLKNGFASENQVTFIPGMVVPDEFLLESDRDKVFFGQQKSAIDIAFIAHKYTDRGEEKGYPIFVEVAHRLHKHKMQPRFHVIGGFDRADIDVSKLKDSITFYGVLGNAALSQILAGIDLIISPNLPGKSSEGVFDGFPTGSAIQAGLRGAAVFCTDELMQNYSFIDKKDLVILPNNAKQITEIVSSYLDDIDSLYELAATGRCTFKAYYSRTAQLEPRIKLLEELLQSAN